jgi:Bacterial SH3 domain
MFVSERRHGHAARGIQMIRHAAAIAVVVLLSPAWLSAQNTKFTVTTELANIHKGPSTGSVVIGQVRRGRVLDVTRELGSWVKIAWPGAEGEAGYVHVSWGTLSPGVMPGSMQPAGIAPTRPDGAARPSASPATPAERPREPAPAALRPVFVTPASHSLGLGAVMGSSPLAFGASARAWRRNRIGVQVDMSRYATTSSTTSDRLTSFQVEPSVLYSLPNRVTDYLWLRPYVGSGATLRRHSFASSTATAGESTSGFGFGLQAFGGGELTFAGAPQFALSADLGYHWFQESLAGFDLGGLGLSVSAHWYMK